MGKRRDGVIDLRRWRLAFAMALSALTACGGSSRTPGCTSASECAEGQICSEGVCAACSANRECAHLGAGATCERGACVSACGEGGCSVDGGRGCDPGERGCECRESGSCDEGLSCEAGQCVACDAGEAGCACRASGTPCDEGLACDSGTCQACAPGEEACQCNDGMCAGSLVCSSADRCVLVDTCPELYETGGCPEGRICEIVAGAPRCLNECAAGWQRDESGECVRCPASGCPSSTCDDCEAQHKECLENESPVRCGACLDGYRMNEMSECVDERLCGGVICGDGEMCEAAADGSRRCVAGCRPGAAMNASGVCVACGLTCDGEGETGRVYPRRTAQGQCVCETDPGFFIPRGGDGRAAPCDEDHDGWVRQTAISARESGDPALLAATVFGCQVREAEAVILEDEYGVPLSVWSCGRGLFAGESANVCAERGGSMPIVLAESDRNDSPELLGRANSATRRGDAPRYGGEDGRQFDAGELNGMTKACVSELADYDDDDVEDLAQVQPDPSGQLTQRERLQAFAHFVELYRMRWDDPLPVTPNTGRLVIEERSRCDESFPLGYGNDTRYDRADGSTYWRNCERRRAPSYQPDEAGGDFGRWTCAAEEGACDAPAVPAHPELSSFPDPDVRAVRGHGLCELDGRLPADGRFRGMNHSSQFQCVVVVADSTAMTRANERRQRQFNAADAVPGELELVFNQCALPVESSTGIGAQDPVIQCERATELIDLRSVGWAAVRYSPYGHRNDSGALVDDPNNDPDYNGGCINEDAEYRDPEERGLLCPSPEFGACRNAPTDAFGRYHCYGWDSLFLWGDANDSLRRSELAWAPSSGFSLNLSNWAPSTGPAASCQ